jgi:ubiquitin-conjugating enzyme E2 A
MILLVFVSIRSLLTDPNASSPANPIAAAMFRDNIKEYNKRVKAIVERSLDV